MLSPNGQLLEVRCSALARPMVCAGSQFFTDLPDDETSPAAMEGTAAGEYLANVLTFKPCGTHASNGVPFDDDMKFFTMPIAQGIVDLAQTEVLCEQRIDWQTRSGIWIRGQYDISFVSEGKLYVDDLKYGWGIHEVRRHWQLIGYAIGEVLRRGVAFDRIVMRIHQPRPHHEDGPCRTWEVSYNELLALKEEIEVRMLAIANGEKTLTTGDKCKYCPAAARHCPAVNKAFFRSIEVAHEFTQDNIDEKELAFQLDLIARASEIIKIKLSSLEQLAVTRIKEGKLIPNYTSVANYGHRKWNAGVSPEAVKLLTGKDVIKKEMMSPAEAEKIGVHKDFVKQLVTSHLIGMKLKRTDTAALGAKIFGSEAPK